MYTKNSLRDINKIGWSLNSATHKTYSNIYGNTVGRFVDRVLFMWWAQYVYYQ